MYMRPKMLLSGFFDIFSGYDGERRFWERVRLARGVWRPAEHIPACLLFERG
jgi:hypothetical protein